VLRGAHRTIAVAAAVLLAGGCSLLVDLSDTTGGTDSGATSPDGARVDVGGDIDASGPAYPPGSWCADNAPALFFCDDFDHGMLGSRWSSTTFQVAGAALLSSVDYRSSPYGFEVASPALMPNTYLLEVLTEAIPSASRITLAFDLDPLMFPADGRGGTLYLATIAQGPGTPRSAIQFRAGTTVTDLQEQIVLTSGSLKAGTGQWESATLVQTGAWTRVEIALDLTTSPATATLRLDDRLAVTASLDSSWMRAAAVVDLGDWYVPSEPAFQVAYDNVTIALLP
jgi:hypothetical protein